MNPLGEVTEDDHHLARRIAVEVGRSLVVLRRQMVAAGALAWDLREQGDALAHQLIVDALASARPGEVVLSEEAADDRDRLEARRVWIVDPLDGTWQYGTVDRDDWAVHIALVVDHQPVVGAVGLPARGLCLSTAGPLALAPVPDRPIRILVSQTRPPRHLGPLAEALGAEVVAMGSAGVKAMTVVQGEADVYVHEGGQYEWDSAAPVAVARAAGLACSRIDGTPLVYNRSDPWLPDLVICRPELAARVLGVLAQVH